jgi:transposase-like protein
VAYPISYRQLEEMMEEHGVEVDHATQLVVGFERSWQRHIKDK